MRGTCIPNHASTCTRPGDARLASSTHSPAHHGRPPHHSAHRKATSPTTPARRKRHMIISQLHQALPRIPVAHAVGTPPGDEANAARGTITDTSITRLSAHAAAPPGKLSSLALVHRQHRACHLRLTGAIEPAPQLQPPTSHTHVRLLNDVARRVTPANAVAHCVAAVRRMPPA